jgi:ParB/RepB/Spo0J family partition protein
MPNTKTKAGILTETTAEYPDEYKPLYVPTKLIKHNHLNPRTEADFADDEELRQSVAIRGVETAIHVRPIESDEEGHIYEVYDGDRRLYAAEKTKLAKIPTISRKVTDDEVIEFGMVSTIRRGLTDVEKGKALVELIKRFPFKYGTGKGKRKTTQRDLALHLGTSVNTINRYLKAATDMDPKVQALVAPEDTRTRTTPPGSIDGRTAYEIAKIDDKERQREVAFTLIDSGLKGQKAREVVASARLDPEATIESVFARMQQTEAFVPTLVLTADDYQLVKAGKKTTVIERNPRPGVKRDAKIAPLIKTEPIEILDVFPRTLGRFTDEDATREGFKNLEELKEWWTKKHGLWADDEHVYVIQFKPMA